MVSYGTGTQQKTVFLTTYHSSSSGGGGGHHNMLETFDNFLKGAGT
jgi:hypothetical protein